MEVDFSNPLKTATIEELWKELSSRQNSCMFVFSRDEKIKQTVYCDLWYSASISELLGLFQLAKLLIPRYISKTISFNDLK